MYANQHRQTAVWMYGPVNSNHDWKVLKNTEQGMDYFTMYISHQMINDSTSDYEDLVEFTKFLVSSRGELTPAENI